ncbi:mandelate racemase/muconate lactonizing enzyme-like protein [Mycobacterium xenopi 3993]|nr:mandelate racemase/muconate lactonizing enzyme-like protein [Mycobacterium xenopi 3993]
MGRDPDADTARVSAARCAIGDAAELFVDANGAYSRKQALLWAGRFAEYDVRWFEEPVSSDDLDGLHQLCVQGRREWTSLPVNMVTTYRISSRCSMRARWTACKPTSPAPSGSPGCSRSARCATPAAWTCRCIVLRKSAPTPARRCGACGTWSISMTTSASKGWPLTALWRRSQVASCVRTAARRVTD